MTDIKQKATDDNKIIKSVNINANRKGKLDPCLVSHFLWEEIRAEKLNLTNLNIYRPTSKL